MKTLDELRRMGCSEHEFFKKAIRDPQLRRQLMDHGYNYVILAEVLKGLAELDAGIFLISDKKLATTEDMTYDGIILTRTNLRCTDRGAKRISRLRGKARIFAPLLLEFTQDAIDKYSEHFDEINTYSYITSCTFYSLLFMIGEVGWTQKQNEKMIAFLFEILHKYMYLHVTADNGLIILLEIFVKYRKKCSVLYPKMKDICDHLNFPDECNKASTKYFWSVANQLYLFYRS